MWSEAISTSLTLQILNQEFPGIFRSETAETQPYGLPEKTLCYSLTLYQDDNIQSSSLTKLVAEGLGQFTICKENVSVGIKEQVYFSFAVSPGGFYVQLASKVDALESVMSC